MSTTGRRFQKGVILAPFSKHFNLKYSFGFYSTPARGKPSVREKPTAFLVRVNVEKQIFQQAGWGCHRNV